MRRTPVLLLVVAFVFALVAGAGGCAASDEAQPDAEGSVETTSSGPAPTLALESSAFEPSGEIPVRFAREGVEGGLNASIPLQWKDVPEGTESFALLMIDTHPVARRWVHWMVVDIPVDTTELPEGASGREMPSGTRELRNSWDESGYDGPEPPEGTGGHYYLTTLYALDVPTVDIAEDADRRGFLDAISGHVLAEAQLEGSLGR